MSDNQAFISGWFAVQIAMLTDENTALRAENVALTAAIERVRALHAPVHSVFTGHMVCDVCRQLLQPCPTLRALEETP